jgi:RNA polymerase sigma-70 factor (ECF subfamily)
MILLNSPNRVLFADWPGWLLASKQRAPDGDAAQAEVAQLVSAAKNGDGRAFEELVRRYQHRVFRLAGRFFMQRADVEDAAQETFLTAWSKLQTFAERAPFEHWLTRVCLNTCYRRLRTKPFETIEDEDRRPAPMTDPNAAVDLEQLLGELEPKDRFMLLLLDGEGWSVAEIAVKLGWSRVNVKVRAHRARKQLRQRLEDEAERIRR